MDNEMVYKMFLGTLSKMEDNDLENALKKAKEMLSDDDYVRLLKIVQDYKGNS